MSTPFEYIQNYYGVPACIGRRVIAYGEPGIIVEDRGNYIGVNLDKDKCNKIGSYHPEDKIEYLGMGKIRKMTRSQKNYQEFKRADYFNGTFAEWMGFKRK